MNFNKTALPCDKLEQISSELKKAHSLLGFLGDYFKEANPTAGFLLTRYQMYSHLRCVVDDIILAQGQQLDELVYGRKQTEICQICGGQ